MSRFARLPFALLFSLRSNLERGRTLTLLTTVAVATSVALATGLEMSGRSVGLELDRTADALAGAAELEVTGGALGVAESLLSEIAAVPGVEVAVPFLQESFRIASETDSGAALYVIGVDLLADVSVRTYAVSRQEIEITDPLGLLADVNSVLVTRTLTQRLGLGTGDRLHVTKGRREFSLAIRGVMGAGGVSDAFGGHVAVMDVYALQTLLGREGWLDRIDVVVSQQADAVRVMERIETRLQGRAAVRRAAARDQWVEYTLATLQTVVGSLVVVGVVVASLLVFGAMSLAVDRRAKELALVRIVGLEDRRARRLVRIDALSVALVGTAVGLPVGVLLAQRFLPVLSGVSAYLQDVEIQTVEMSSLTLVLALGVGIAVALAGSFQPSRRATAANPLDILRDARTTVSRPILRWIFPVMFALIASAWFAVSIDSLGLPPLVRTGLILGLGLVLVAAGVSMFLPAGFRLLRPLLERLLPGVGRLAGASLTGRARHTGITVAAVAGVLAGVTATLVIVDSLSSTLDSWLAGNYDGAVLIMAGSPFAGRDRELVAPATTRAIRAVPNVKSVSELFTGDILYQGEQVLLVAQTMAVLEQYTGLPAIGIDPQALAGLLADGEIAVSDAFSDHFGIAIGDALSLDTPKGSQTFQVAGIFRDYVGPAGSLQLDIAVFDRFWPRGGAYMLAAWTQPPADSVVEEIRRDAGSEQDLYFVHGEELDRYASSVLSQFTRLLSGVASLTALLGAIAVMNLLVGSVSERRRELALLRAVGTTDGQLVALLLVDGALVALLGGVGGIGLGVLCAYPMVTDVVREAFGWSIVFRVRADQIAMLLGVVVGVSVLTACYPALMARRVVPRDVFAAD